MDVDLTRVLDVLFFYEKFLWFFNALLKMMVLFWKVRINSLISFQKGNINFKCAFEFVLQCVMYLIGIFESFCQISSPNVIQKCIKLLFYS